MTFIASIICPGVEKHYEKFIRCLIPCRVIDGKGKEEVARQEDREKEGGMSLSLVLSDASDGGFPYSSLNE